MTVWIESLNRDILHGHGARLVGGFTEPFYKAPTDNSLAEIQFTRNYERSALHELAHWSIAGEARRCIDDYGYWYEPDGRTGAQQQIFYRVEIKPQAIEQHFCAALELPFETSMDNLALTSREGMDEFILKVDNQFTVYMEGGLPDRAMEIVDCLRQ